MRLIMKIAFNHANVVASREVRSSMILAATHADFADTGPDVLPQGAFEMCPACIPGDSDRVVVSGAVLRPDCPLGGGDHRDEHALPLHGGSGCLHGDADLICQGDCDQTTRCA